MGKKNIEGGLINHNIQFNGFTCKRDYELVLNAIDEALAEYGKAIYYLAVYQTEEGIEVDINEGTYYFENLGMRLNFSDYLTIARELMDAVEKEGYENEPRMIGVWMAEGLTEDGIYCTYDGASFYLSFELYTIASEYLRQDAIEIAERFYEENKVGIDNK